MTPDQLSAARRIANTDAQEVLRLVDGSFVVDPSDFACCQQALGAALKEIERMEQCARTTLESDGGPDPVFALAVLALGWREEAKRLRAELIAIRNRVKSEGWSAWDHRGDNRTKDLIALLEQTAAKAAGEKRP